MRKGKAGLRIGRWPVITGFLAAFILSLGTWLGISPAGATWLVPAVDLTPAGQDATSPRIAIGPEGLTTVVWIRDDGSRDRLEASTRLPGQTTFGAPEDLTPLAGGDTSNPEIAIGPDGTTVVSYGLDDSGIDVIGVTTRPPGSDTFSDDTGPPTPPTQFEPARVAVGPGGTTTLVWSRLDAEPSSPAPGFVVTTSTRDGGSNAFSAPLDFSLAGFQSMAPQVAAASDGTTTVIYELVAAGSYIGLQAVTRPPGAASFSSVTSLEGSGGEVGQAQIAAGPDSDMAVVWKRQEGAATKIRATTRGAWPASFTPIATVSEVGSEVSSPRVAVGPGGATTAVWLKSTAQGAVVQATTRASNSGSFTAPITLSSPGASPPGIAIAPDGAATVVWARNTGTDTIVQASSRPVGSASFSAPIDLSATGPGANFPRVAAPLTASDPCRTYTTAVWERSNGTNKVVQQASEPTGVCRPSLAGLKAKGPMKVRRGKKATYRVTLTNVGSATATGLKLKASGKGVKASKSAGSLAPGKSKTVKVPIKFKKKGKIKVTFTLASSNAGKRSVKKTVKVG